MTIEKEGLNKSLKEAGALVKAQIDTFQKKINARGWYKCPECGEDYAFPIVERCGPCRAIITEADAKKKREVAKSQALRDRVRPRTGIEASIPKEDD